MRYVGKVIWVDDRAKEGVALFQINEYTQAELRFSRLDLHALYRQPAIDDDVEGDIYIRFGGQPMVRLSGSLKLLRRGSGQVDWANSS